jgi:predicted nucleotidyltransferase
MKIHEIAATSDFDPNAVYLHGTRQVLRGRNLTRYGKNHSDMGALFFCKDSLVGRWYSGTYGDTIWLCRIKTPVDRIFSFSNPRHQKLLQKHLDPQEYQYIAASSRNGHLDWAVVDEDQFTQMGFRGVVFIERAAGMATGLPEQSGLAALPEDVLSVGIFDAADVEIIGSKTRVELWTEAGIIPTSAVSSMKIGESVHEPSISPIPNEPGMVQYDDGNVQAVLSVNRLAAAIYEFSSRYPKQGNGREAVRWIKKKYHYVVVIDPGDPHENPDSFFFWSRLAESGLIDEMQSGDGDTIYKQGRWLIEASVPQDEHLDRIQQIIQTLKTDQRFSPFLGRIKVFGSIATGSSHPGDVDIFVDLSDLDVIPKGTNAFLALSKQYYGLFDPFIYINDKNGKKFLYTRSDSDIAPRWIIATNAASIITAGMNGKLLSEL